MAQCHSLWTALSPLQKSVRASEDAAQCVLVVFALTASCCNNSCGACANHHTRYTAIIHAEADAPPGEALMDLVE
eukprot:3957726-Amphidinium_carterae.3